jgi:branched-chain amino acid transport system substrate-binding protein
MRTFRSLVLVALVLATVLVLAACASPAPAPTPVPTTAPQPTAAPQSSPSSSAASKAPSGEPIKVGAIFPVSGQYAPMGGPMNNAALLVQDTINGSGGIAGRPLQFIIYDDEGNQAKSLQLTDKLISQDKVVALVGPIPTANAQADTEVAEKSKVPMLYTNPTLSIWQGKNYIFQINHDDAKQADALLTYIEKTLQKKSIAILHDANPYGSLGAQVAADAAKKRGITVTADEKYAGTDTDVTPQLTKIKNSGAEALVLWGVPPVPGIATKQLRQLGSNIPVLGSDAMYSPAFISLAGEASEGVYSVTSLNTDSPNAVQAKFVQPYNAKYGSVPTVHAAFVWDAAYLLKAAIEKNGKTDADSVVQGLLGNPSFVGVMGPRNYTKDDHNGLSADSLVITQVKGGKWVMLSK